MASSLERLIEVIDALNRKVDALADQPTPEPGERENEEGDSVGGFRIISDPSIPAGEIHLRTLQDGRPVVHKITGITRLPETGDDDGEE